MNKKKNLDENVLEAMQKLAEQQAKMVEKQEENNKYSKEANDLLGKRRNAKKNKLGFTIGLFVSITFVMVGLAAKVEPLTVLATLAMIACSVGLGIASHQCWMTKQ